MKRISILLIAVLMVVSMPVMSFANEAQFTKAEFIKKVFDAAEVEIIELEEPYSSDVVDKEYVPYIETAYEKGIISEDTEFYPNDPVTKEEAVIILVKIFGERTKVKDITEETIAKELDFTDSEYIVAKQYVTYALKNDLIKENKKSFYPVMHLTESTSKKMIDYAKKAHDKYFTRDGLAADEILILANEKLEEQKTFKATGKLDMDMSMSVEGLPAEDEVEKELLDQGMSMQMVMEFDMQSENPDKSYIKEVVKSNTAGVESEDTVEVFMDGSSMYQKMTLSGDKWVKSDISSMQSQIQSLQDNNPQNMAQLSEAELAYYKDYATFGENEIIDGKECYVVNIDLDKEAYERFLKEYTQEIMEASMNASLEQQNEVNVLDEESAAELEMAKQLTAQMLETMDMEMSTKYYINKNTMNYEKADMSMNMYMNMDSLIQMILAMSEEDVDDADLSKIKVEMVINMDGQFDYYDFGKEVTFPEITEDDIFNMEDAALPQN